MLTQENLEKIDQLPSEDLVMSKFLKDNIKQNIGISAEIEKNMAFAMIHYNEESRTPYLFRRISSTSTLKSIYFNSSPSSNSSQQSLQHELQMMVEEKPTEKVYYNILVAGDSGLGKTSFINTYMYLKFNYYQIFQDCSDVVPTTNEIIHNKARRTEGKIDFFIDFIDSPGYGSFRDITIWTKYISKFLLTQMIRYKESDQKVDERVHCCLYFIDAVLKHDDIVAMREISRYTAIIPVIGKADICTAEEMKKFKKIVLNQLIEAEIRYFQYEPGPGGCELNSCIGICPPLCVISAVSRIKSGGKPSLGRVYNWGYCDINNAAHSDFPLISKFLIGKFYNQVKTITKNNSREILRLWNAHKEKSNKKLKQKQWQDKMKKFETVGRVATAFLLGFAKMILK